MQEKLVGIRRNEFGMTQKEFAEFLDIPYGSYTLKERGATIFTSDEMFDISKKLKKPIDKIFSRRKHQNGDKIKQEA